MRRISLIALAAISLGSPLHAADFGVYGTAGTVGFGGGVATMFNSHLGARLGYTTFEYEMKDLEESNLTLDGEAKLGGLQALLDVYPFGGGLRLSFGAMQNAEITARARPVANTFTFDDEVYSASDIGDATGVVDYDSISPYAGIGFVRALSRDGRFAFAAELGVVFTGAPQVNLNVTCRASDPTVCAELRDHVAAEQAELQSDADEMEYCGPVHGRVVQVLSEAAARRQACARWRLKPASLRSQ
jgi:hypothetical protein